MYRNRVHCWLALAAGALLVLGTASCRSGEESADTRKKVDGSTLRDGGPKTDRGPRIDGGPPSTVTIYDIHQKKLQVDDPVRIENVVATTAKGLISGNSCLYGVWVQDPQGGEQSGILVTAKGTPPDGEGKCTGGGPIPDDIQPGAAVSAIEAKYVEFPWSPSACDFTTYSQLSDTTVFTAGAVTMPPVAAEIDSVTKINDYAKASPNDAEKWAGVLVKVSNVVVKTVSVPGTDGKDHGDFAVCDAADNGCVDMTRQLVINAKTFPGIAWGNKDNRVEGKIFASVTGVLYYSYCHFKISLRSDADLVE